MAASRRFRKAAKAQNRRLRAVYTLWQSLSVFGRRMIGLGIVGSAILGALQLRDHYLNRSIPRLRIVSVSWYDRFDSSLVQLPGGGSLPSPSPAASPPARPESTWVFSPILGLELEVANDGLQPLTFTEWFVRVALLRTNADADVFVPYRWGTLRPGGVGDTLGDIRVEPRSRTNLRLVVPLRIGLSRAARDSLAGALAADPPNLSHAFSRIVVAARTSTNRVHTSDNFMRESLVPVAVRGVREPHAFVQWYLDARDADLPYDFIVDTPRLILK